jgi:hypothetical protein
MLHFYDRTERVNHCLRKPIKQMFRNRIRRSLRLPVLAQITKKQFEQFYQVGNFSGNMYF